MYIIYANAENEQGYYYYYRYLLRATCFLVLRLPCYKNDCTQPFFSRFFLLHFHFSLVSPGHSHVYIHIYNII